MDIGVVVVLGKPDSVETEMAAEAVGMVPIDGREEREAMEMGMGKEMGPVRGLGSAPDVGMTKLKMLGWLMLGPE